MSSQQVVAGDDDFRLRLYRGDGNALLAFDVDQVTAERLAGFAIKRVTPDGV